MKKIIPYIIIVIFSLSFLNITQVADAGFCINSSGAISGGEVVDKSACKSGETFQEFKPVAPTATPLTPVVKVNTATNYLPLAPLPGFDKTFNTSANCAFGTYLDAMLKIFIGIAAVLAMVMIVLGGLEYMTSELVSSKEHGKERIRNAILGLLIALGAVALLNTINPTLLNKCLNTLPMATIVVGEAPPTAADFSPINTPVPTGAIGSCTEGITKPPISTLNGDFLVCNSIKDNLILMIAQATREGYDISGWGWRSNEKQIELRKKNGCPDIYTSPASACKIPTAIPGESMHESGLAVDLTCGGAQMTKSDRCYLWLQKNASTYKFYNLSSEAWHWSTNGK